MKKLQYMRSILKEANSAHSMPKKTIRKWKKKERQRAKKEIEKQRKDS